MANAKYPNGYYPKIAYWTERLQVAIANKDLDNIEWILGKIQYFTQRQALVESTTPRTTFTVKA